MCFIYLFISFVLFKCDNFEIKKWIAMVKINQSQSIGGEGGIFVDTIY